ncbi:MAG TPA: HEPN domain-containing protein [Caulobacteraceae bacterium]|jgi:hypothetical protein|nr:HEPN domain-containing protein [Caulobacteraceae bacterium]
MSAGVDLELATFRKDIKRNSTFLAAERRIGNPASARSRPHSETLLSAFVLLTCGRFEGFLQGSFYQAAVDLRDRIGKANDPRIPNHKEFHWNNLDGFLSWVARARIAKTDKIPRIEAFSAAISTGDIFPDSFKNTESNPNFDTLDRMFGRFGVKGPLAKLAANYLDNRGRHFAGTLIKATLNEFVRKRHLAAHTGRIPGLTRMDADDYNVFVDGLAESICKTLNAHTASVK